MTERRFPPPRSVDAFRRQAIQAAEGKIVDAIDVSWRATEAYAAQVNLAVELIPRLFNAFPYLFGVRAPILKLVDPKGDKQPEDDKNQKSTHS